MKNLFAFAFVAFLFAFVSNESYAQTTQSTESNLTPRQIAINELVDFIGKEIQKEDPNFTAIGEKLQSKVDAEVITEEEAEKLLEMTNVYFENLDKNLDKKIKELDASIAFKDKLLAMLSK